MARTGAASLAARPALTLDGVPVPVYANLAGVAEASHAVGAGAEGCGLLRTEFVFMDRRLAPTEEEQLKAYQAIASALEGRPLVIRTLDIGGDKPAPYLDLPHEDNPALGLRGVRTSLWRPELLRVQLRAILRVAPARGVRVMAPMVASLAEIEAVRALLEAEARALGVEVPPLGVMVETPAAAVTSAVLAEAADFFSIGTNDLTQYALAMDRANPAVAGEVDALHPAVLRLIALACDGATARGRPVGVCGALASDPLAAPLLIGLGAKTLSAAPGMISEVKAAVRKVTRAHCAALAQTCLGAASAREVREALLALAAPGETETIR
jgi:phosphoenolpyruvate-protein kinase (PTS system EI component)